MPSKAKDTKKEKKETGETNRKESKVEETAEKEKTSKQEKTPKKGNVEVESDDAALNAGAEEQEQAGDNIEKVKKEEEQDENDGEKVEDNIKDKNKDREELKENNEDKEKKEDGVAMSETKENVAKQNEEKGEGDENKTDKVGEDEEVKQAGNVAEVEKDEKENVKEAVSADEEKSTPMANKQKSLPRANKDKTPLKANKPRSPLQPNKQKSSPMTENKKLLPKKEKLPEVKDDESSPYLMLSTAIAKKPEKEKAAKVQAKSKVNAKDKSKVKVNDITEDKESPKVILKVEKKEVKQEQEEQEQIEKEKDPVNEEKKEVEETGLVGAAEPAPKAEVTKKKKKKQIVCILDDARLAELNKMPRLLGELKRMLDLQRDDVASFADIVDVVDSAMVDLEVRHMDHMFQLVWRIDSFYSRFKDAREKIKPIIYSPSFETHPHGYKMALSMCPYGDGKFRGEYMAIFYCLLKSDHDSLQTWPFSLPITISLVSQASDEDDRVDHSATFTPNPINENKAFLGRPQVTRNPSLGFPKFIPIEELWEDEFVKDNQLFIKVQVNTSGVTML